MEYEIFNNAERIDELKDAFLKNWRDAFTKRLTFKLTETVSDESFYYSLRIKTRSNDFGLMLFDSPNNPSEDSDPPIALGEAHSGVFSPYNAEYEIKRPILITRRSLARFTYRLITQVWSGFRALHDLFGMKKDEISVYCPKAADEICQIIREAALSESENNGNDVANKICDVIESAAVSSLGSMSAAFDWTLAVLELYFWNVWHDKSLSDGVRWFLYAFESTESIDWEYFRSPMSYNGKRTKWIDKARDSIGKNALVARAVYMLPASSFPKYRDITVVDSAGGDNAES